MYASVYLGYRDGKRLPSCHYGQPLYGRLQSERVQGFDVVNLWPPDFPLSARLPDSKPMAALWRPQLSGILDLEFGLSGVERKSNGQWIAQRWLVEPMSFAAIERNLAAKPILGEIKPSAQT